ncbi:hypothetical protein EHQ68_04555 [Leptospira congkakensis]|uniref:Lipoprotein n=1 Tax=Leptospira congkakensis TaxID=2484932 RepID=A0A4Z1ADH6_9LEPT|nr:hypothetical protein [Leptospira congkakensis]TGL90701.1 hypothetical protein EHQ69_12315 [Leptospira congkakensis]TGL91708.1 hypothetical protein EHQ68_04555 [Leptospira congkakensis]TGL98760.1 hypothetical protein EHQ70_04140 [Leptospira congkakensis]
MNKNKAKLKLFLLLVAMVGCGNNSEEKCKDDAKIALRDSCFRGLITNPIIDTDNSSYDLVILSCMQHTYKLTQCRKKKGNVDLYSIVN